MDEFDKIKARIERFVQNIMPFAPSPDVAEEVGTKMKACIDLLRHQYDAYLNESDPAKKAALHEAFHAKADEFLEILKWMGKHEGVTDA